MAKTFLDEIEVAEQASSPGTPPSGYQYMYPKTDGKWYAKNSAGVETEMTNVASTSGQTENFNWKFDTATGATDPGSGYFRFNNATPALVTQIYVDYLCDITGFDISAIFNSLSGNYSIYIQQTDDATKFIQFDCVAPFIDNTGWFTIPVTFVQVGSGGLFGNNKKCTWYIINRNGVSGGGSLTGTAIISFPAYGSQEDESVVLTVSSLLITNANVKSVTFIPLVSSDHDSLDDYQWDGLTFNIENIVDNVSFDIRCTASNDSWGDYNVKYIINY